MKQTLLDAVYKEIGHYLGRDILDMPPDTSLDDLDIDSLDAVELVMQMEDNWRVCIPGDTEEKFDTIQGTVNALANIPGFKEKFIV